MKINTKIAKVTNKQTVEVNRIGLCCRTETIGYCSECGAQVGHNQYGFDQDCPNCDAILDWDAEEGE